MSGSAPGVAEQLRLAVLAAYDRLLSLEREQLAVDGGITKAPCGGQTAGPSPTDRRNQGPQALGRGRGGRHPVGGGAAPANHRDDGLPAATVDAVEALGLLPAQPVVHLDAADDDQSCRQVVADHGLVGEVATVGCPRRSRWAAGG
jgi:hypothetical protein